MGVRFLCLLCVVKAAVSATGRSLAQRSPTVCVCVCVCVCDLQTSTRRHEPTYRRHFILIKAVVTVCYAELAQLVVSLIHETPSESNG